MLSIILHPILNHVFLVWLHMHLQYQNTIGASQALREEKRLEVQLPWTCSYSLGLRFTAQRGARWQWPEGPLVGPVVLRRPCYRWTADPGPAMAVFGLRTASSAEGQARKSHQAYLTRIGTLTAPAFGLAEGHEELRMRWAAGAISGRSLA